MSARQTTITSVVIAHTLSNDARNAITHAPPMLAVHYVERTLSALHAANR